MLAGTNIYVLSIDGAASIESVSTLSFLGKSLRPYFYFFFLFYKKIILFKCFSLILKTPKNISEKYNKSLYGYRTILYYESENYCLKYFIGYRYFEMQFLFQHKEMEVYTV